MSSRSLAVAVVLLAAAVAIAQPVADRSAPNNGATILPANSAGFVSINVAQLWDHKAMLPVREARGKFEFAWIVESLIGIAPADIERLAVFWKTPDKPHLIVVGRKAINVKAVIEAIQRPGAPMPAKLGNPQIHIATGAEFPYLYVLNERTLLLAPQWSEPNELIGWLQRPAAGPDSLSVAIDAANKHELMVAVDVKALADLPLPVGAPLLEAKTAVLSADLIGDARATAQLTLMFPTPAQAKAAESLLRAKLKELAGWAAAMEKKSSEKLDDTGSTPGPLLELFATTLKSAKVRVEGTKLIAAADFNLTDAVARVMLAAPDSALANRGDSPATNNMKQIGLAIHNYHDVYGHCPSNSYDKNGKPLLSWRVHILPFIEQDQLFKQFKFDEPWDSAHNKPLAKTIVKVYAIPGRPTDAGLTHFQSLIKPKGSADPFNPWLTAGQSKGPKFVEVPDGTSNTIMVAEGAEAVIWSQPDDLVYEANKPVPKLGGPNGRYTILFGDGSVRTFRRGQIDDTNLRRIITRDDGMPVNIP